MVDDDAPILRMVSTVLARESFNVDACEDADEAVRRLSTETYDAIVLALATANPAAHAKVLEAIDAKRNLPCVVLISAGSQPSLDSVESRIIAARLRKPFDITDLVTAVRSCVNGTT